MSHCTHSYSVDGTSRTCPRPATDGYDRCVFHLAPAERSETEVSSAALREAFLADVRTDEPGRREYVDIHLETLDLSALVVDGSDVDRITFRNVTVDGMLDLSGSVVAHPIAFEGCRVGFLDATDAAFGKSVTVEGSAFGSNSDRETCFRARRCSFERGLRVTDVRFDGSVGFPACSVEGWLTFDEATVAGRAHFPDATFETAQFVSPTFEDDVELVGAEAEHLTFERPRLDGGELALADGSFESLRVDPAGGFACRLDRATVRGGRLDQPPSGEVCYDLTDATVGDVDVDCEPDTLDRYRFYRTRFDGFRFASYRGVFRANRWRLHEYVGTPAEDGDTEGLEQTYLEARQGASASGDSETASKFFVRELRYRRRYGAHALASEHSPSHRADAVVRWLTNGFLDAVAGYGERPGRTALLALVVILGSAVAYPATAGLSTGTEVVSYARDGPVAFFDGLYFSVVTFATLGLGDVHPVGDVGRFIAASEGLSGAFLTAVFVFSLGRRVTH